jgi:hypothetical protein
MYATPKLTMAQIKRVCNSMKTIGRVGSWEERQLLHTIIAGDTSISDFSRRLTGCADRGSSAPGNIKTVRATEVCHCGEVVAGFLPKLTLMLVWLQMDGCRWMAAMVSSSKPNSPLG